MVVLLGTYTLQPFPIDMLQFLLKIPSRYLTIYRASVDSFVVVEFVFFLMQGSSFPSYVIKILMLQTTHILNSHMCNPRCLPFESGVTIIKVCSPKLPIVSF